MFPMTPWVKRLLIANVAVFFVTAAAPWLYSALLLYPPYIVSRPWSVFTYMFLHAGFGHLFFNMIGLFFFGPRLEQRLGSKGFLWLYFLSGLGGAVGSFLFARQYPVVGASGAVYGVLLGFALFWPRERIYIWGILPVEAWLLAALLVGGSLWAGVTGSQSGTAHFAHLGGLAFGFAYIKIREWRSGSSRRAFEKAMQPSNSGGSDRKARARWQGIAVDGLHEINRDEVRRLLAKVESAGPTALTQSEREFLDRMAAR
jgi:membrane associated rhomboid family serine protease